MSDDRWQTGPMRPFSSKGRVADRAARQWGRITRAQLIELGIDQRQLTRWLHQGYLHRRLPRVYAVGHAATSLEAALAEALLYAGPGAMLRDLSAAHWLGLLAKPPRQILVSTPRQCRSLPGIKVHARRPHDRIWHNRLPTTTLPQLFLDIASSQPLRVVRKVLANADYKGLLDVAAVNAILGLGRPGSVQLRLALASHQPSLALTKSDLEILWTEICDEAGFPMPEINFDVGNGWDVDALWLDKRIAVEVDGPGNHRSPAQMRRDRRKDMYLRSIDLIPLRYSDEQLTQHRQAVIAEIRGLRGE